MILLKMWEKQNISLGVMEFVEFHGIMGCVQKAILEKNFSNLS